MSLSSFNPPPPNLDGTIPDSNPDSNYPAPNYGELVRFLLQPFLEEQQSLRLDCEISSNKKKVWIRVAFEGADRGRVFGRGGRNIQAVRSVLGGASHLAGQSVHLDIYGSGAGGAEGSPLESGNSQSRRQPFRSERHSSNR